MLHNAIYCIAQIFGRGKPWQMTGGLPNFTIQILAMFCAINKESKQTGIHQSFTRQKFLMEIHQVFLYQTFTLYGM